VEENVQECNGPIGFVLQSNADAIRARLNTQPKALRLADAQVMQALAAPVHPVPLTDEQIQKIWDVASGAIPGWSRHITYARAIEAAHGITEKGQP
jgi:hypothetical protein